MTFNSINKNFSTGVGNTAQQQSFLGTTIESFNVTAGFGDNTSTCTVNLATDNDFNSDGTALGLGVDVYHTGGGDKFRPPPIGTPVFFSYGLRRANVGQAFVRTIDDYYGTNYAANFENGMPKYNTDGTLKSGNPGYWNFAFGGILQSYTQNESNTGGLRHTVTITDPREILANCTLILNNYGGTTFNNSNLINIYGFLEHNAVNATLRTNNDPDVPSFNKDVLNAAGQGMDVYSAGGINALKRDAQRAYPEMNGDAAYYFYSIGNFGTGNSHPMTGTGMSRRSSSGIPYYRVVQAYNYLMGFSGAIIQDEYIQAGYGGFLKFRGLQYAVDLSSLPILPKAYMLDFDAMSILDFCQEVCEVANHELFFTLLPIVPGTATGSYSKKCVGIIKAVTIDKSVAPAPGQIRKFVDSISDITDVTRLEVGYELTNETTDKVVTGGKESSMYYLPTPYGGPQHGMHHYHTSDPIVPYYGNLSPNVPTIPRGYGSFAQICLDAGSCQANGVGRYYIATEMELRVAAVSYEKWEEFLLLYNNLFMESVEGNDIQDLYYASQTKVPKGFQGASFEISNNYQVTVPRCVWPNHTKEEGFGSDGAPKNPCHPPYGYPLYWGRARSIGIPRGGAAGVSALAAQIIDRSDASLGDFVDPEMKSGDTSTTGAGEPSKAEKRARDRLGAGYEPTGSGENPPNYKALGVIAKNNATNAAAVIAQNDKLMRSGHNNSKIVYDFVKKVADECLGKKYLVQVPQRPNPNYTAESLAGFTAFPSNGYTGVGPYGFPAVSTAGGGTFSVNGVEYFIPIVGDSAGSIINNYLKDPFVAPVSTHGGGLAVNYNAAIGSYTFNYTPAKAGGYYGYYGTPDTDDRVALSLEPADNAFLRSSDGRTECYVRFCNSQNISFANFDKGSYTQQFVNPKNGAHIPDVSYAMENSQNPNDVLAGRIAQPTGGNSVTVNGQSFVPHSTTAFVKADIDEEFYIAPPTKVQSVKVYGNKYGYNVIHSQPQKLYDEEDCTEYDSYAVNTRYYFPKNGHNTKVSLTTIDLDQCYSGKAQGNARAGVYALITLPDRAVPKISTTFRDGMDMQIQAANIKHYLQLDIVRGMPGISNQPPLRPQNSFIHSVNDLPRRENDPLGLTFYQSAQQAARKAYQGLGMSLLPQIMIASPSPVVPDLVALPLQSEERSYGPWTSFYNAYDNIGGKMEYIHDESLTPWNYGGYSLMDKAGRTKVEMGTSAQLMAERGSFNMPMEPSGITLANTLYNVGGPLVTDISIKVDSQGIETAVKLTTYTASFGKTKKQREDQLKKMTREHQKMIDTNNNLIRRNIGKSQRGFSYNAAINQLKKQLLVSDYASRNYSHVERYGSSSSTDTLNYGVDPQPSNAGGLGYVPGADPTNAGYMNKNSSLQSQEAQNFANNLMSISPVQALRTYWNTASDKLQNLFAPTAAGWHSGFTVNPPEKPSPTARDYGDGYDDRSISVREPEN